MVPLQSVASFPKLSGFENAKRQMTSVANVSAVAVSIAPALEAPRSTQNFRCSQSSTNPAGELSFPVATCGCLWCLMTFLRSTPTLVGIYLWGFLKRVFVAQKFFPTQSIFWRLAASRQSHPPRFTPYIPRSWIMLFTWLWMSSLRPTL